MKAQFNSTFDSKQCSVLRHEERSARACGFLPEDNYSVAAIWTTLLSGWRDSNLGKAGTPLPLGARIYLQHLKRLRVCHPPWQVV